MPFTPILAGWRVAVDGNSTSHAHNWSITFGISDTDDHTALRASNIGDVVAGWAVAHFKNWLNDSNTIRQVRVTDETNALGPSVVSITGLPVNGTRGGDPAGGQVAAVVTLRGPARGRANRGRIYLPGLIATDINAVDGYSLDSDRAAAAATMITQLHDDIEALGSGTHMAVLSRSQGVAVLVTDIVGRTHLGTQRRRVR